MVNCKAKVDCFYAGKKYKAGAKVSFKGLAKDLPKHLTEIKETKTTTK